MAKAQFHKNQRVWVEAVGAWALVERVLPVWSQGFEEPVKITYDVGLGREFKAEELRADAAEAPPPDEGTWRLMRAKNKWQTPEETQRHPFPGTFPVVVTDANDWGGWRTPAAEYDRDPDRIEAQARLIAGAPRLLHLARDLVRSAADAGADAPPEMTRLASAAAALLREVAPTRSRG